MGTDLITLTSNANWPIAIRLSIHPKLRHRALLTDFPGSQDMKHRLGSTPLKALSRVQKHSVSTKF